MRHFKRISDYYRQCKRSRSSSEESCQDTISTRDVSHTRDILGDNKPQKQVFPLYFKRNTWYSNLPLEWFERGEDCKDAKSYHMSKIDYYMASREDLVLLTTLCDQHTVLEKNMFPYMTPKGVEHWTLWSKYELSHVAIIKFVDDWLSLNMPHVRRWQYDDNSGERSISLFHVHVFIETDPFSFSPRPGQEYFPPHLISSMK